jgi:hypothetical protein
MTILPHDHILAAREALLGQLIDRITAGNP